jgi:hypothetical protein
MLTIGFGRAGYAAAVVSAITVIVPAAANGSGIRPMHSKRSAFHQVASSGTQSRTRSPGVSARSARRISLSSIEGKHFAPTEAGAFKGMHSRDSLAKPLTASDPTYYWYYPGCYGASVQCWSTDTNPPAGQFGDAMEDDIVGATYAPDHALALGADNFNGTGQGGDYCYAYGGGTPEYGFTNAQGTPYTQGTDMSWITGFKTPTPYSSYQVTDSVDAYNSATCQGANTEWGFLMDNDGVWNCSTVCGMQHAAFTYADYGQYNDFPWLSSAFTSSASLWVGADEDPNSDNVTATSNWHGYLCAVLQETVQDVKVEYCAETWRSDDAHTAPYVQPGDGGVEVWSQLDSTDTKYMTSVGSATTFNNAPGNEAYGFAISGPQLSQAMQDFNNKYGGVDGTPLSTDPDDYALYWLEDGFEGGGNSTAAFAGNTSGLTAFTAY